ncbi:MAG: hypothetical protein HN742_18810 [Lentisphaerae bacterium]|jgi:hypothetical protein|nr:hypothetical protein [Lentisphaerota bacterium]MBT4821952.1 hypothetical protein [Lentisphaerota bacterium]MBT5605756.1 hypothetical protein [Lentisphaerota bacterium]MBT7053921.1 hypothetical protein [Lentisphaerota bacterium]MBT7843937.1 hypothetical protein [Lentisphaerota bacterium]
MEHLGVLWVSALIAVCTLIIPAGHAAGQAKQVADFEKTFQGSAVSTGGGAKCSVSTELTSRGTRSLRMVFERYEEGAAQWPSCGIELPALEAPRDWRNAAELLIDLHVESDDDVLVKMVLTSEPDGRWVGPRSVAPGKWSTIRLPLWLAAEGGLRLDAVQSVTLVLTRPPHPAVIHMDNLRLHTFELSDPRSVEWFLTSPSFHQGFFHTKPEDHISARWECRTTAEDVGAGTARFSLERADGTVIDSKELTGEDLADGGEVSFTKPEMEDDESVTLKMAAMRGGKVLWEKASKVKQYPPGGREITLRDDGVTLVDGKPFFPFGMYSSPTSQFALLKKMGFNAAHSYAPVNDAYMNAAEKAGLLVVPRMKGKTKRRQHIYHDPELEPAPAVAYIDRLKDSPALLGYYLFDEPNPGDCPRAKLLSLCDLVRKADPYHLAVGCNNSFQTSYYRVSDAMMVDNYPIPGPMAGLIRDMRDGAAAQAASSGLWFIPQAFNYETHFTTTLEKRAHGFRRPPTFDEIRTMPWLAVALGARGLFYYSFQTQGFYLRNAFPWFWRGFEHHVHETVVLLPWLTERTADPAPTCASNSVHIVAWKRGTDWLVVAANAGLDGVDTQLVIPKLADRQLHVISEDRDIRVTDGRFHETFEPLETHIYVTSLEPKMAALPTLSAVRAEVKRVESEFWSANPSVFTYRDGARLHASWGFPDPEKAARKVWYRMIDGYPGTQWVVGNKYSKARIAGWSGKDFRSPGRWVEVRASKQTEVSRVRAIVTPGVAFQIQIQADGQWRTLPAEAVPDDPPCHHHYPSATTTACFSPTTIDRFRVLFPEPGQEKEVVFELSAWRE